MKYKPTIFIDNEEYNKLQEGTLKIQCGQWIQFDWCDKPSRWVGLTKSGTIWATHWPSKTDRFVTLCQVIDRKKDQK